MPNYYRIIGVVAIALLAVCYFLSPFSVEIGGQRINVGGALAIIVIAYYLFSAQTVDSTEGAVLFVFGRALYRVTPGLVIALLVVTQVRRTSVQDIEEEVPGDPERLYLGDDPIIPPGFIMPARITFAEYVKGQTLPADIFIDVERGGVMTRLQLEAPDNPENDPLNRRITAPIQIFFRYVVIDPKTFLIKIGSHEEALRQLTDVANSVFVQDLTRISASIALKNLWLLSKRLEARLDEYTKDWGINFKNAEIKGFLFSHLQNRAMSSVMEAQYKAQAEIRTAEGDKTSATLRGEGQGAGERAVLTARTEGLKSMMDALGVPGEAVLGAEVARAVGANANKTVVVAADNLAKLAGTAFGLANAVKEDK